jgi:hypothetical protein
LNWGFITVPVSSKWDLSTFYSVCLRSILILPFHLYMHLKERTLPVGVQIKRLYIFVAYPMCAAFFNRPMPLDFMMLMMIRAEHELRSSSVSPLPSRVSTHSPQHAVRKTRCSWFSRSSHYFFVVMEYLWIVSLVYH